MTEPARYLNRPVVSLAEEARMANQPPSLHIQKCRVAMNKNDQQSLPSSTPVTPDPPQDATPPEKPKEYGGPKGPEPTRYGDWEKAGRCIDF